MSNIGIRHIFDENSEDKKLYIEYKIPMANNSIYIPLENKKIISKSFNLYNVSHIFRKIHKKFIEIMSRLFNIRFFYKKVISRSLSGNIKKIINNINGAYCVAIYVGTECINGKYTLQIMDKDANIIGYAKIAKSENGNKYIINEKETLEYLNKLNLQSGYIPDVVCFDDINSILVQSTKNNLRKDKNKLNIKHINFLSELYQKTKVIYTFKESEAYRHILDIKEDIEDNYIQIIEKVLYKLIYEFDIKEIQYCFSHNDFYTHNIKEYKDSIFVYDWEVASISPIYFDIFHYIYEQKIKRYKNSLEIFIESILNDKYIDRFEENNNIDKSVREPMLIIYLCEIIYNYKFNLKFGYKEEIIKNSINMLNILVS